MLARGSGHERARRRCEGDREEVVAALLGTQNCGCREDTYAMHVDLIRHGRQICRAQRPRCMQCPLRDPCVYGSTVA